MSKDTELLEMQPEAQVRLEMLREKIRSYQRSGYDKEIEAAAIEAQLPSGPAEARKKVEMVKELLGTAANMYKAARRLKDLLEQEEQKAKEAGNAQ